MRLFIKISTLELLVLYTIISAAVGSVCSSDFSIQNEHVSTVQLECEGISGGSGMCHGSFTFNYDFDYVADCIMFVRREGNTIRYNGWKCAVGESDQKCQITILRKTASD